MFISVYTLSPFDKTPEPLYPDEVDQIQLSSYRRFLEQCLLEPLDASTNDLPVRIPGPLGEDYGYSISVQKSFGCLDCTILCGTQSVVSFAVCKKSIHRTILLTKILAPKFGLADAIKPPPAPWMGVFWHVNPSDVKESYAVAKLLKLMSLAFVTKAHQ